MKGFFLLVFVLASALAFAQTDTLQTGLPARDSSSRQVLGDSIAPGFNRWIMNPARKLPGFLNFPEADKINSLERNLNTAAPRERLNLFSKKINPAPGRLTYFNSVNKLHGKNMQSVSSPDSLRHKLDSMQRAASVSISKSEKKFSDATSSVNGKVKNASSKLTQEMGMAGQAGIPEPTLNMPGLNLLGSTPALPTVPSEFSSLKIPGANKIATGDLSLPAVGSIPAVGNLPASLLKTGELSEIEKEAGALTKETSELKTIANQTKMINPTSANLLSDKLTSEAASIAGVKQLETENSQLDQYKQMVKKWQADPEYSKELALTKAKQTGTNYLAGHEKQLESATGRLNKVKTKYKKYEGTLDMYGKPGNAMKGKPLIERLRPGVSWQIQGHNKDVMIDFNPYVAYRISGRMMAGAGWNQRFGYNFSKRHYEKSDLIYGPRLLLQFKIKEHFYAVMSPEIANALVPPAFNSIDPASRRWVWVWMAGLKKEFQISRLLLGNAQFLYNFYDPRHQSPYVSRLNIRIGFEIPLRKRSK